MKGAKRQNTDVDLGEPSPPPEAATSEEHRWRNSEDAVEEAVEDEKESDDEESGGDRECEPLESEINGEKEEGRTKLADGYYEIEAVRRRRIRKGKVQYLIKWRGWSEAANTWEPVANLLQCSDVIDAFEASLKSGRSRSTRKRKRKAGVIRVQAKRKQQYRPQKLSPSEATYNVPSHIVRILEDPATSSRVNNDSDESEDTYTSGLNSVETSKKMNKNGAAARSVVTREEAAEKDEKDLDLKLCDLRREAAFTGELTNKLAVTSPEGQFSREHTSSSRARDGDEVGPVRFAGAKRRKSGPVKRFKKDETLRSVDDEANGASRRALDEPAVRVQHRDFCGNNCRSGIEDSKSLWTIKEIIRPISYKASIANGRQEVVLAFEALRSDGTKVIVDNKVLKANNPLLLIEFYEKHLRYSPT